MSRIMSNHLITECIYHLFLGHPGLAFYLIISGKVSVQVPDPMKPDGFREVNEMGAGLFP